MKEVDFEEELQDIEDGDDEEKHVNPDLPEPNVIIGAKAVSTMGRLVSNVRRDEAASPISTTKTGKGAFKDSANREQGSSDDDDRRGKVENVKEALEDDYWEKPTQGLTSINNPNTGNKSLVKVIGATKTETRGETGDRSSREGIGREIKGEVDEKWRGDKGDPSPKNGAEKKSKNDERSPGRRSRSRRGHDKDGTQEGRGGKAEEGSYAKKEERGGGGKQGRRSENGGLTRREHGEGNDASRSPVSCASDDDGKQSQEDSGWDGVPQRGNARFDEQRQRNSRYREGGVGRGRTRGSGQRMERGRDGADRERQEDKHLETLARTRELEDKVGLRFCGL